MTRARVSCSCVRALCVSIVPDWFEPVISFLPSSRSLSCTKRALTNSTEGSLSTSVDFDGSEGRESLEVAPPEKRDRSNFDQRIEGSS